MASSHEEIAEAYLEEARIPHRELGKLGSATTQIIDLTYDGRWEDIWSILVTITQREEVIDNERLAFIAAGPLEDLICKAGPEFIERIEHEAKFNRQFAKMLTGVWLNSARPDIRERVVKFCRAFNDPLDAQYRY
jgi:hypothetical protein